MGRTSAGAVPLYSGTGGLGGLCQPGLQKDCMLERNRFLVEHSDILLAVYNGERRGGTAATIRYARKAGREVWIMDPETHLVTREEGICQTAGKSPPTRKREVPFRPGSML